MKHVSKLVLCSLISIVLTGCGAAEFSGTNSNSKTSANGNESSGVLGQGANDDANGNLGQNSNDDAAGALPQISIDDFLGLLAQDPALAAKYVDENDCYISHSGGHGMDLCVTDPTPLLPLSVRGLDPRVEVKGNEICAKAISIQNNAAAFKAAGATIGRCN